MNTSITPAEPDAVVATVVWCATRGHPWVTYNPWLDRTWCRCGLRSADGEQPMDWHAKHEVFHRCPYAGGSCRCYLAA